MPKSKLNEEENKEAVKVSTSGELKPIEWASQKSISSIIIAGAFHNNNEPMTEAEFEEKLKAFMEKPAAY